MAEDLLEARTDWTETDHGKQLEWECPDCGDITHKERRHATVRCPGCKKIMQSKTYSAEGKEPDPENPEWYLKKVAKRRDLPEDHYLSEEEPQSALSW